MRLTCWMWQNAWNCNRCKSFVQGAWCSGCSYGCCKGEGIDKLLDELKGYKEPGKGLDCEGCKTCPNCAGDSLNEWDRAKEIAAKVRTKTERQTRLSRPTGRQHDQALAGHTHCTDCNCCVFGSNCGRQESS